MFAWLTSWLLQKIAIYGVGAVFLGMVIESACIPLPSEIIMPLGGLLVQQGKLKLWEVVIAGTMGNYLGGVIAYLVGRTGGRKFIKKYGRYIFLSQKHLSQADQWFKKSGEVTVFISRMLPGVRTFISLPAGISHMSFWRFTFYTLLGSFPWVVALTYAGYFFGANWDALSSYLHKMNYVLWGIAAIALVIYFAICRRRNALKKVKN